VKARLAVVLTLLLAPALATAATSRVVLVPFDGQAYFEGREAVMAAVIVGLARRGYEVVGGEQVERFLEERRIRYLGSLSRAQVVDLAAEMQADAVMMGAILDASTERITSIALSARLVKYDGRLLWTAIGGEATAPVARPVGVTPRRPRELVGAASDRLLADLPEPGRSEVRRAPQRLWDPPRSYRAKGLLDRENAVCLLPLRNHTAARTAAQTLEGLLGKALGQVKEFRVVEPADLRRAFVEEGIWGPALLSQAQLRALSSRAGGCLFLSGDIFQYGEVAGERGGLTPAVEVYVSLHDPQSGRIVWSGLHRRLGAEYEQLLELGALQSRFEVADKVVEELVRALY
jgi:hypothetical protein